MRSDPRRAQPGRKGKRPFLSQILPALLPAFALGVFGATWPRQPVLCFILCLMMAAVWLLNGFLHPPR